MLLNFCGSINRLWTNKHHAEANLSTLAREQLDVNLMLSVKGTFVASIMSKDINAKGEDHAPRRANYHRIDQPPV